MTSAVEAVWAAVGAPARRGRGRELAPSRPLAAGPRRRDRAAFGEAEAALDALRSAANADPLALMQRRPRRHLGRRPAPGAGGASSPPRIAELDRLRSQARRPDRRGLPPRPPRARAARADAVAAWQRAATADRGGCRRCRPRSPNRRWRAWPRSRPAASGAGWGRSSTAARRSWPRPARRPRSAAARGGGLAAAMSCAGCSAPTRPRPPAWGRPRTRRFPAATTRRATCSGRRRATWRRPRRRWPVISRRSSRRDETAMTRCGGACAQPGCGGTIEDGYCDGLRPGAGTAARRLSCRRAAAVRRRLELRRRRPAVPAPAPAPPRAVGAVSGVRLGSGPAPVRVRSAAPAAARAAGARGRQRPVVARHARRRAGRGAAGPGARSRVGGPGRPAGAGEQAVLRQLRPAGRRSRATAARA